MSAQSHMGIILASNNKITLHALQTSTIACNHAIHVAKAHGIKSRFWAYYAAPLRRQTDDCIQ